MLSCMFCCIILSCIKFKYITYIVLHHIVSYCIVLYFGVSCCIVLHRVGFVLNYLYKCIWYMQMCFRSICLPAAHAGSSTSFRGSALTFLLCKRCEAAPRSLGVINGKIQDQWRDQVPFRPCFVGKKTPWTIALKNVGHRYPGRNPSMAWRNELARGVEGTIGKPETMAFTITDRGFRCFFCSHHPSLWI